MKAALARFFYRHEDTFRRAGKTTVQGFLSVIITSNFLGSVQETATIDATQLQKVIISAGAGALAGLISFIWNYVKE